LRRRPEVCRKKSAWSARVLHQTTKTHQTRSQPQHLTSSYVQLHASLSILITSPSLLVHHFRLADLKQTCRRPSAFRPCSRTPAAPGKRQEPLRASPDQVRRRRGFAAVPTSAAPNRPVECADRYGAAGPVQGVRPTTALRNRFLQAGRGFSSI